MGVLEGSIAKYVGDLRWCAQSMGVTITLEKRQEPMVLFKGVVFSLHGRCRLYAQ